MAFVKSQDGTQIAYDKTGEGPALILVVGAFNERPAGAPLAQSLASHFTVYNYDRRGRGESGDSETYAVEREIEDLQALIGEAGGSASVFGYSSGAILAVRASAGGLMIDKLALYSPAPTGGRASMILGDLTDLIKLGKRGEAVELFQTIAVGIPRNRVVEMRTAPFRPGLEKIAHTLVYDATILNALEPDVLADADVPTLVMDGDQSPPVMRHAARALAEGLPNGRYLSLQGEGHDLNPAAIAGQLRAFLLG